MATATHTLTIGAILSSSWGYEQTLVDFYMVTRVTPASVYVVKINKSVNRTGTSADRAMPCPDRTLHNSTATPMRKKVKTYSGRQYVTICDYASAYEWNGTPQYQTGFGYGH